MKKRAIDRYVFLILAALSLPAGAAAGGGLRAGESAPTGRVLFLDDCSRPVLSAEPARRIISLYSAHTENLFALGLEDAVIGVDPSSTYPAGAREKPKFDYRSDPEKVIAASPDLVLIRPFIERSNPDFVSALENAGIRVVCLYPETFDEFHSYVERLALLTGRTGEARERLDRFDKTLRSVRERTEGVQEKVRVYFESTATNYRTVTADSMPARAIELAGGINAAEGAEPIREGSSIAPYGAERLLSLGDRIDVFVAQSGRMNPGVTVQAIADRPGFYAIRAVREGRVYVVDENIVSRPTFRFAEGVRTLADLFYPDLF
jgi:iron complex transport system substrate-binding protein